MITELIEMEGKDLSKVSELSVSLSNVLVNSHHERYEEQIEEKKPLLFKLEMFSKPAIKLPVVTKQLVDEREPLSPLSNQCPFEMAKMTTESKQHT